MPSINQSSCCFEAGWKLPPTVRPKHHPEFSRFVKLKYIGIVPAGANFGTRSNYRELHPISKKLTRFSDLKHIAGDVYSIVKPTNENVLFSIRALENKPDPVVFDENFYGCFRAAISHFDACYGHIFRDGISSNEETAEYIDFSKSSGFTGTFSELRTKFELASDPAFRKWFRSNGHLKTIPLWSIYPKIEYKLLTDILNNKIRLFTIPPYDLLYEQIRFGKRSTLRLKNHLWSAYGFNPYSGGVDRLARRLLRNRIFWCLDISGWDKFLPLMGEFYSYLSQLIRNDIPTNLQENFDWMVKHTVSYFFKTPYGDVFYKNYGNPSGSGCTTRDNTCIHIWIIASALIYAYYKKFDKMPTSEILNFQVVMVFGDDVIGSVSDDFDYILSDGFWQKVYGSFGLKLKFVNCGYDIFDQLEFLGFRFVNKNGHYYPLYDVERIATSFIYKGVDNDNYDAFISRAFTLMVMSYPTEHFKLFYKSYQDICDYFYSLSIEPTPTILSFLTYRNLPLSEIDALYTGVESANSDFLNFFLSGIQNVGFCNIK